MAPEDSRSLPRCDLCQRRGVAPRAGPPASGRYQASVEAFLEGSAPAWSASYLDTPEEEDNEDMDGRRIGPFVVLQRLGHGGTGDVFLAVREQPFKQYVALKIIRRDMDSREVVERFAVERFAVERQILAAMNYPNNEALGNAAWGFAGFLRHGQ